MQSKALLSFPYKQIPEGKGAQLTFLSASALSAFLSYLEAKQITVIYLGMIQFLLKSRSTKEYYSRKKIF